MYQAFRYVALIFFIISIGIIAIKLLISSIASQKAHYKELLKHWVIGIILLVAFHWVMIFTINLSEYLVKITRVFISHCNRDVCKAFISVLK